MCNIQVLELALGNKINVFRSRIFIKKDWNSAFTIPNYDVHEKGRSDEVLNLDAMEKSLLYRINFILQPIEIE